MNNVNKIINRTALDLRKVVFSNRAYILSVAYISFNKHFFKYYKNAAKTSHRCALNDQTVYWHLRLSIAMTRLLSRI